MCNACILTTDEKKAIEKYIDAIIAKISNNFNWIQGQVDEVTKGISKIDLIRQLDEQKFRLYLKVGNALNELKGRTDAAGIPWKEVYKNLLKLPETNQRRWRRVATAKVDERYYYIGVTNMHSIIKCIQDVDDSIDTNDILKEGNFKRNQGINYEMEARRLAMLHVTKTDPKISKLQVTKSILEAIVETKAIKTGKSFWDIISEVENRPIKERDTYLKFVLASETKNHDKEQSDSEPDTEGIISLISRLVDRLENGTKEMVPEKKIKRLFTALENYNNF